jgi:hypothetical protein
MSYKSDGVTFRTLANDERCLADVFDPDRAPLIPYAKIAICTTESSAPAQQSAEATESYSHSP